MLSSDDFVTLPHSQDLTVAGITHLCRVLHQLGPRRKGWSSHRLRQFVAQLAAELAFRRWLAGKSIDHHPLEPPPPGEQSRPILTLSRRRCAVIAQLVARRETIRRVRRAPEDLLDMPAQVNGDALYESPLRGAEVFVFAHVLALVTTRRDSLRRAIEAGQPFYLIYLPPKRWNSPAAWRSLGRLALKSDASQAVKLEIGGQDEGRRFISERVSLSPRRIVQAEGDYHTLTYLHPQSLPDGPLGVHSPVLAETLLVHPRQWTNLWLYGLEIVFSGYVTAEELRRRARPLSTIGTPFPAQGGGKGNLALLVGRLHPLDELTGGLAA